MRNPRNNVIRMHPILGFGWIGWGSLAILAVLIGGMALGVDWLYEFQRFVDRWTGLYSGYDPLVINWHHYYGISLVLPSFGLIGLLYLPIALFIHPRKVSMWPLLALVIWALARPFVLHELVSSLTTWLNMLLPLRPELSETLAIALAELPTALLLWILTRSTFVAASSALVICALSGVAPAILSQFITYNTSSPTWVFWTDRVITAAYHISLASALVWWAIASRRQAIHDLGRICSACGYDLHLATSPRCPECGAAREVAS